MHRATARITGFLLLLLVAQAVRGDETTLTIPAEPPGGTDFQRVRRLLPPHVGCAVMVLGKNAAGEAVAFKQGYGFRRLRGEGTAQPPEVTPQTSFRLAGLTKVFTAAAVLRLADEGRLALDDPLTKWLPGMPATTRGVTVRQMLDHTSGLPAYTRLMNNRATPYFNDLALLRTVAKAPRLDFPAGTRCVYSDTAYVLLGLVVQQASGQPFHRYLRTAILEPAGMKQSVLLVEGLNDASQRAYGHKHVTAPGRGRVAAGQRARRLEQLMRVREQLIAQNRANNLDPIDRQLERLRAEIAEEDRLTKLGAEAGFNPAAWREEDQGPFGGLGGDGALYASLDDIEAFLRCVAAGEFPLSRANFALWMTPQKEPLPISQDGARNRSYAAGWMIDQRLGERRLSHRGAAEGFRQTLQWLPDSGRAVVVLMNSVPQGTEAPESWDDDRIEKLGEQILSAVLDPQAEDDDLQRLAEPFELRR